MVTSSLIPAAGSFGNTVRQGQIIVRLDINHVSEQAAGLQPDTRRVVTQIPHTGENVAASRSVGDELGADRFTLFRRHGDAVFIRLDTLHPGHVLDSRAVVDGGISEV